jgi:hypothetical protein
VTESPADRAGNSEECCTAPRLVGTGERTSHLACAPAEIVTAAPGAHISWSFVTGLFSAVRDGGFFADLN